MKKNISFKEKLTFVELDSLLMIGWIKINQCPLPLKKEEIAFDTYVMS